MKAQPWEQWKLDDALKIPADVTEALPRFKKPETFIILNAERMAVCRKQSNDHVGRSLKPGCTVEADDYEDCWHCRRERLNMTPPMRARIFAGGTLDYVRDSDIFWCNSCQGTGWLIEPWETAIARLRIVTWDDKVQALDDVAFKAALSQGSDEKRGYPVDALLKEAARRLAAKEAA